MVYESDFYTTRRPYRYSTPSYSTYTITTTMPSRQVRLLPGLGKVHIVHSYDRIVPYVGHKRLTVVTSPPKYFSTRPSILQREYDWIEKKIRPWLGYSATNNYLNSNSAVRLVYTPSSLNGLYQPTYTNYYRINRPLSSFYYWPYSSLNYLTNWLPRYRYYLEDDDSSYRCLRLSRIFDDETRLIRAKANSLLKCVHLPVPRNRSYPITSLNRYGEYPARLSNDHYINRLMHISPKNSKVEFVTYYTDPVKRYIGQGHLSCLYYVGDKGAHSRRRNVYVYEDPVRNDIQLLSFYINKFKEEKQQKQAIEPAKVPLSPLRPSRRFNTTKQLSDDTPQEIKELREARAARLAKINAVEPSTSVEDALKAKKQKEEARLAEEKALAEEQAAREAKEAREKKEKAAREAAERAAELERQAELLRQEELNKQAEIEKQRREEEMRLREEEEKRREEEARAEEEKQQLVRLQEIARQAEEEKEAELARQAEELAELARQEAELLEQERKAAELEETVRQEKELAELKQREEELAELERQEREIAQAAEDAKQEAELAIQNLDRDENTPEETHTTEEKKIQSEDELESEHEQRIEEEEEEEHDHEVDLQEAVGDVDGEGGDDALEVEEQETEAEAEVILSAQDDTADEVEEEEE